MGADKLGARVRKYREDRSLSREELADAAGLKTEFIAALEDDNLYPSIGPLQKLARALNVRLGTFMDDAVSRDPIVSRQGDREADLTMQKSRNKCAAFRFHSLGKGKSDRNMEPFFIEICPEPAEDRKLSSHQGEEFILVNKGAIRVVYGKEEHVLGPGDSIYYNSIVPHYVGAEGDGPAEIYAVIYYP